jgi:hypothetical protein
MERSVCVHGSSLPTSFSLPWCGFFTTMLRQVGMDRCVRGQKDMKAA